MTKLEEQLSGLKQEMLEQKNAHADALHHSDRRLKGAEAKQRDAEYLQKQVHVLSSAALILHIVDLMEQPA